MKTPLLKRLLCGTSLCLLTGAALAQTNDGRSPSPSGTTAGTPPSGSPAPGAMQPASQAQRVFHAREFIGQEARNSQGERLGKIEDVAFNPHNGEAFAAIGVGGGRYALVPWQALSIGKTWTPGKAQVTVNTSKSALHSGPTISSDEWQKLSEPSFAQSIYGHYKLQAPGAMGGAGTGAAGGGTSTGAGAGATNTSPSTTGQP